MNERNQIKLVQLYIKQKSSSILARLNQTSLVLGLFKLDENVGKKQSAQIAYSRRSLRFQRIFTYGKSFIMLSLGTIVILSWDQFALDSAPTPITWPDQFMEYLMVSNSLPKRTPFAIDHMLKKGMDDGQMDSLSYATLGRVQAQINYSDLAYTSYYMAHLKDHQNFGANSDLTLETSAKQKANDKDIINEE